MADSPKMTTARNADHPVMQAAEMVRQQRAANLEAGIQQGMAESAAYEARRSDLVASPETKPVGWR